MTPSESILDHQTVRRAQVLTEDNALGHLVEIHDGLLGEPLKSLSGRIALTLRAVLNAAKQTRDVELNGLLAELGVLVAHAEALLKYLQAVDTLGLLLPPAR